MHPCASGYGPGGMPDSRPILDYWLSSRNIRQGNLVSPADTFGSDNVQARCACAQTENRTRWRVLKQGCHIVAVANPECPRTHVHLYLWYQTFLLLSHFA